MYAVASSVSCTNYFHLGEIGSCARRRHWQSGTIPFSMRNEKSDYPGAICDSKRGAGDGNLWWYINSTALRWATSQ
jgi:hypothetical protein